MSHTDEKLEKFYEAMQQLPENVSFEEVRHWVNHPAAAPKLPKSYVSNLLKNLIMSSVIVTISAIVWYLFSINTPQDELASYYEIPESRQEILLSDTSQSQEEKPERMQDSAEHIYPSGAADLTQSIAEPIRVPASKATEPIQTTSCSWPQDTIVYISDLVVTLDLHELEPLGFYVVDNGLDSKTLEDMEKRSGGYYYKNQFEGVTSAFYNRISGFSAKSDMLNSFATAENIKETFSELDFYPVAVEDAHGDRQFFKPAYWINGFQEKFEEIRYELVPVRFKVSGELESNTYYFKSSPEFFNRLPKRYAQWNATYQCIKKLHEQSGKQVLRYTWDILQEKGQYLYLDQSYLEQLGFHISDTSVIFAYENATGCGYEWILSAKTNRYRMPRSTTIKAVSRLNPLFMTNTRGELSFTSACREFDPLNDPIVNNDLSGFDKQHELLIPVVLSESIIPWLKQDYIIWYEPSDSLFAKLPPEIGAQIKSDYEYLTSANKFDLEANCTYFTVCETVLKVNDFRIYPNPARDYVNVSFELEEGMNATISIYDLQGKVIDRYTLDQHFAKGQHVERLAIAGLSAGVYMVRLSTPNGYKASRLVVAE